MIEFRKKFIFHFLFILFILTFFSYFFLSNIIFGDNIVSNSSNLILKNSSQEYYENKNYWADVDIYVDDRGYLSILGETNVLDLKNISNVNKFTSKKGEYWILNFSTKEKINSYIYRLHLPKNIEINYIKTTPNFRIVNLDKEMEIIGIGENSKLSILIQYKFISNYENSDIFNNVYFYLILIFILFLVIITFILYKFRKSIVLSNLTNTKLDAQSGKKKVYINIFPKRQQDIINILIEKEKISQKELEKIMEIPKSSISRNLKSLEMRNIIYKEKIGNVNYIFLNENFEYINDNIDEK